jgi:hypothetical protein
VRPTLRRWESWLPRLALAGLAAFQLAAGNPPGAFVAVEGVLVSLVPPLIVRLSGLGIPRLMELLFVFGITLQFVSESTKLYELLAYWDKIVHPTLVALTAWLGVWLLLGYRDAYQKRLPIHLVAALALLLGVTVGAVWEFVEFGSDWFGDSNLQKSNADTMSDFISNDLGAFVATLLGLRLYARWLGADQRTQAGQLARWLALGPSRVLDAHGRLIGATSAPVLCLLLAGAAAIDIGWPPLPTDAQQGISLTWTGLSQTDPPAAVVLGDWLPDTERGTCRINLDRPRVGSEKMGLLQIAPGRMYGSNFQLVSVQAPVFEERPAQFEGTQMDGGIAFGIRDAGNFYLLEQSALHDVLRLSRYVHNRRRDVQERLLRTRGNEWHTLQLRFQGQRVVAGVDGQDVLRVDDVADTAGGIGLWARATAATCFSELSVEVSPPRGAIPVPGL